jgi:purine-nucleoside/S-methyl-5'-thioadenosine phosphorylase / adenosine deaminase
MHRSKKRDGMRLCLQRIVHDELVYYRFSMWPDLRHGVFSRKGGVSQAPWNSLNIGGNVGDDAAAVRHNHDLIYNALSLKRERACTVWMVHSADVIVANRPLKERHWLAKADGMITDSADTPLVMRYADCTPLLFYAPVTGVIGIAHGGWRGTVQGIAANTVRAMVQTYGCKPRDIQACIGPSIGPDRYQVGEEVVDAVQHYFGTVDGLIRRDPSDGSAYFDLWAANKLDLERAGVGQIEVAGMCTAEQTDEFFSHRAEKGRTGRFGVVLSL